MPFRHLVAGLLVLAAAVTAAARTPDRHVVLISIDALRPDFYLDDAYATPELRALVKAGAHARAAESVFPTVTYPSHASIATGVRPLRHGIPFNVLFDPEGGRGRWYEEAADLRAVPIWEWARTAGLRTAAVSWPATLGARIDTLVAERDYYQRADPVPLITAASTPGVFARLGIAVPPDVFKDVVRWDAFLTQITIAILKADRPHLLLLHLVQVDSIQHRVGRDREEVKEHVARVDDHVGAIRRALADAGLADRSAIVVTGDHGFQNVERLVLPNVILSRAGLRACPFAADWRATVHVAGGAGAVFVRPADDAELLARTEAILRAEAGGRYTVLTRAELDVLGAMPGVALGIEASPGYSISGTCSGSMVRTASGGTHGYLPSRPTMATGFIAAGAGIRQGVTLDRMRLIDVAPTVARLLSLPAPDVEGQALEAILDR
jgi:arylsulfatase A-like enzyme